MALLIFDGSVFDGALFGGESVLLDDSVFDGGIFDVGLASPLTQRRALYWDGSVIREITDALIGAGKRPIVILNGSLKERVASEGIPVVVVNGKLRCLDATTESLTI